MLRFSFLLFYCCWFKLLLAHGKCRRSHVLESCPGATADSLPKKYTRSRWLSILHFVKSFKRTLLMVWSMLVNPLINMKSQVNQFHQVFIMFHVMLAKCGQWKSVHCDGLPISTKSKCPEMDWNRKKLPRNYWLWSEGVVIYEFKHANQTF